MVYNRKALSPHTVATAAGINAETAKIKTELDALWAALGSVVAGTPIAAFTWMAFADSADGTSNFTTGQPGNRSFIGLAYGRPTQTESTDPSAYTWTRFRGSDGAAGTDGSIGVDGSDGADGADGDDGITRDIRFKRSVSPPATPTGLAPAGWFDYVPSGTTALYFTVATLQSGILLSTWSTPTRLTTVNPRGPYQSGTAYYLGDVVELNGGTYILAVASSTGNAPSGSGQANAFWDVLAAPGATGTPATPPSAFSATINLTSASAAVNLRTIADAAGYTGHSDATITFNVPNTVSIQGVEGGGIAIDTGTWPTSEYAIVLNLVVQSGGKLIAGGGHGGDGGYGTQNGGNGGFGGDAIYCRVPISITIDSGGEVKAGGGGGAGGTGGVGGSPLEPVFRRGGGGGGGFPNGFGGNGHFDGDSASISGGGLGGSGASGATAGGAGGNAGMAGTGVSGGASAGAAGYAVRKNGFTVPVVNNGSMTGTAA